MAAAIPIAAQIGATALVSSTGAGLIGSALIYGASAIVAGVISRELISGPSQSIDIENIRANAISVGHAVPLIYGERLVGGTDVFYGVGTDGSAGSKDERYVWVVQVLGEGACEGISTDESGNPLIYIDNKLLGVEIEDDLVKYWFYNGTSTQTYNAEINRATRRDKDDKFTDAMRDTCYIIFRLTYDQDNFSGIPRREVVLRGIKITDVRNSVNGWSRNPANILHDYLTNSRYGLGWDTSYIDAPSWAETATYCDSRGWQVDYAVLSHMKSYDIIETLLGHFRGYLSWYDGKLYLKYIDLMYGGGPVFSVEDKHIARGGDGAPLVSVSYPNIFSIPDAASVTYVNKRNFWTTDTVVLGDGQSGQIRSMDFVGFTERDKALSMAAYVLERQREAKTYHFVLRPDTVILEPNDVITILCSELVDLVNKDARIVATQFRGDGLISVTAILDKEGFYDNDYNPDASETYEVDRKADITAEPPSVELITFREENYITVHGTRTDLHVSFVPPQGYPLYRHVEAYIMYPSDDIPEWSYYGSPSINFVISNVRQGETIKIRLNVISQSGAREDDVKAKTSDHFTIGVTDPSDFRPQCPTYFRVNIDKNSVELFTNKLSDNDIASYEIRVGNHLDVWEKGIFVTNYPGRSVAFTGVRPGVHNFMLNTVHTNGSYCETPLYREVTIPVPPGSYQYDEHEIDFKDGTYDNTLWYEDVKGIIHLKRDTNASLGGSFVTEVIELDNQRLDQKSLLYLDGIASVSGVIGRNWDDLTTVTTSWWDFAFTSDPSPGRWYTWSEVVPSSFSEPPTELRITLEYSNTDSPFLPIGTVENMQILTGISYGKYVRLKFELRDFSLSSYIDLDSYTLRAMYLEESLLISA